MMQRELRQMVAARPRAAAANEDDDDTEAAVDPRLWVPKKLCREWKNKEGVRHFSMIITLSSGAVGANTNNIDCGVSDNGLRFTITERWTHLMENITEFYDSFPRAVDETMYEFNRRMFTFEDLVKELRLNNDAIVSTHHVMLPFPVDPTTLRTRFVGTEDGAKYCHVDLAEKARKVVDKVYNMQTSKNRSRPKEMNEYSNLTPNMMK